MSEHEEPKPGTPASQTSFQQRPQRCRGWHRSTLLILVLGGIIILGGGGVLAWQLLSHSTPAGTSGAPKGSAGGGLPPGCTGARIPVDTVQQETANGLHLTVDQVTTQVQAGKTVAQIATARGITPEQLRALEIHALQVANARWLQMGCITQQDVDSNMQRDVGSPAYMDEEFTDYFR
jgi:uncharacterized protein (DUF433 family)